MKFRRAIYWILIFVGFGNFLLWLPMSVIDILQGRYTEVNPAEKTSLSILVGLMMSCGIMPLLVGIVSVFKLRQLNLNQAMAEEHRLNDELLKLAVRNFGKLTVVEAALGLNISIEQADHLLSRCMEKHLAEMQVSESGILVYHFLPFITGREKQTAETI